MRLTKKALTTVATWADMHNKPVLLGDIPWKLKRHNLLQEHHMTTMQDYAQAAMLHSHTENSSLYEGTLWTNPDTLLHSTDEYMATLLQ